MTTSIYQRYEILLLPKHIKYLEQKAKKLSKCGPERMSASKLIRNLVDESKKNEMV